MKKLFSILFIALGLSVFAQETITEGVANLKTTLSSSDSQMNAQFAMIGDINSVTYFKDNLSRTETSNVMTGTSVSIMDGNTKEMLTYMDNPMAGKLYMKQSFDANKEDLKDIEVEKTGETKEFLGYECTKYIATINKNGANTKMEIYTTDKISAISNQTATLGESFEGFPLYMTIEANQQGMNMILTIEVTDVKQETVSSDKFDMTPPEGYKETDNLGGM